MVLRRAKRNKYIKKVFNTFEDQRINLEFEKNETILNVKLNFESKN